MCVHTELGNVILLAVRMLKYDFSLWKTRKGFWNWPVDLSAFWS